MTDLPEPTVYLHDITTELLDERDAASRDEKAAAARVRACNVRLQQLMLLAGAERHQHADGSVIQWVRPTPRETVIPEKLLAHGIAPHVIQDCTEVKPVAPYLRVDRPKFTTAESPAEKGALADAATPERPQ
jgi:hypothetical protein